MSFNERIGWLILGGLIGFVLGYIVRSLREIKENVGEIKQEVDEIDGIVKEKRSLRRATDEGFSRFPIVADIALLCVVILTVWAAFASQKASNDVKDNQERITRLTVCNQEYLSRTIRALNLRTTYTQDQVASNVELQTAQARFFGLLLEQPPRSERARGKAAREYFDSLTKFISLSQQSRRTVESYPFPTNEELRQCLNF